MRHRKSGRPLGRTASHRKALARNQVTDLLRYGRVVTTEAKAKELRSVAERAITLGKRGDLHARRQASALMTDRSVLRHLFETLGPTYRERRGGYTRITKLGPRLGDGAEMAQIELVAEIEITSEAADETLVAETPTVETTEDDEEAAVPEAQDAEEQAESQTSDSPVAAPEDAPAADDSPESSGDAAAADLVATDAPSDDEK